MPQPMTRASRAGRATLLACVVAAATVIGVAAPAGAAKKPKPVVTISPGEVAVYKVGNDPQALPDDVRNAVMATVAGYVNAATVKPLQKGRANDTKLASALAPSVAARLTGPDRAVLVDEGLPKSVSKIVVTTAPITLTGLADGDGRIVVVTANLDATAKTKTTKGKLSIHRAGELVLTPDNGTWKISGYSLIVDRLGNGLHPTTATTAPAAPAAPAQGAVTR